MDVIAHQVDLMTAAFIGRVNREFGRRKREDQPAMACVNRSETEHVPEERADLLSLRGEHDCVDPIDHAVMLTVASAG